MTSPLYMITECWRCDHVWSSTGKEYDQCPECGEENFTGWSQDAEDKVNRQSLPRGVVPHCRHHLEFRSDCGRCVSEREFSD